MDIKNSKDIKIPGLLGMQLFKRFEMIIDYQKSLICLHLINKKEASTYQSEMLSDESAYNTFPINIMEDKLLSYGEIAGKNLTFIFDTGTESNVLDSRLPNKIFEQIIITRRIMLAGGGTRKVEALYGDMKNMKLGDEWVFTAYLSPGKHLYKFVADGKWILDPGNKLWEQDEHNTRNTVLWVEK